ncbi:hypothetical protein NP233_g4757 [Leucocoprinus birnbaumii]|uniref:Uncharacterized protein n=1 Tax=Leucocoprinus birnbaumii TaxID=56174 RepID=A0AAD5VUK1_9AGAR|nr:hypothetical protein NP233_g4757 [Leucocoprinus birnbaumii]
MNATHDSALHEKLLESLPETTHHEFIYTFASWALQQYHTTSSIALIKRPRSDLAQLCTEHLDQHLAATYILSDPNYDDPAKFFTTIAYQLASHSPAYAEVLENAVRQNPAVVTKCLEVQFQELILGPLKALSSRGIDPGMGMRKLIIVDGFDGYRCSMRTWKILRIVIKASTEGLPLRWAFFSRKSMDTMCVFGVLDSRATDVCWRVDLEALDNSDTAAGSFLPRVTRTASEKSQELWERCTAAAQQFFDVLL